MARGARQCRQLTRWTGLDCESGDGQLDAKARAAPDFGLDLNDAFMSADDAVADREAQTHARLSLRREERIEDAQANFFAHADACVADRDFDLVAELLRRKR